MRKLIYVITVSAAILFTAACSKEHLEADTEPSVPERTDAPALCSIGKMYESDIPMEPAELTPQMFAAAEMTKADVEYTIPVVFHIFGADQWSGTLNAARMEKVLKWINNDFNGVKNVGDTEYFGNIHADRKEFVDNLPIQFVLAKYTKDGTALKKGQKVYGGKVVTSGTNAGTVNGEVAVIIYSKTHPLAKAGPGNNNVKTNSEMKKIAWDNKMYMNVYITNDLYANGKTNESGVAWYPDATMTNANVARVVYNGWFLPGGTYFDKDFTSVITHEFGHFLNLAHTFDGGCVTGRADSNYEGDYVKDTPQMLSSADNAAYQGHGKKNCNGAVIDYGNFMNYGVYSNFTKEQVKRMKAALQTPQRKPLWQQSNLDKVLGKGNIPSGGDPATFGDKLKDINAKLGK